MTSPCNCHPLKSLEELLKWKPEEKSQGRVTRIKRFCLEDPASNGRVLLCHDMRGGYLDEDLTCCRGEDHPLDSCYRFFHWSCIDIFVYFSHHFITIPPKTWRTAANVNGVPICGTIITESDKGYKTCKKMLSNPVIVDTVVDRLVSVALHHDLQGWLVNIENIIKEKHMKNLLYFLDSLTKKMHSTIEGSQVIWYDSVIYPSGHLNWQNALNDKNIEFFKYVDSIFLNYTWTKELLTQSVQAVKSLPSMSLCDIFVGVDVFGRGCPGGGGWNTREAIEIIHSISPSLSVALFAPGWTHEKLGHNGFHANQIKWWESLKLPEKHVPSISCVRPLKTTFCQGWGVSKFVNGKKVSDKPWFNLSCHQLQVTGVNSKSSEVFTCDAFNGGSCLRLYGKELNDGLAFMKFHISSESDVIIRITFKPANDNQDLSFTFDNVNVNCREAQVPVGNDWQRSTFSLKKVQENSHIYYIKVTTAGSSLLIGQLEIF